MSLPPVETPLGAMRFNSDSQKLEYWMGSAWMQIKTFSPDLDGGARGVFMGFSVPGGDSQISYITIPTQGNTVNFGSRTISGIGANLSSRTRGLAAQDTAPTFTDTIDFITLSSTGNATDFGDRTIQTSRARGCSNQTRGMWAGGFGPSPNVRNQIDYVTISHAGNAIDFGDLTGVREAPSGNVNSPTRAIWTGGDSGGDGSYQDNIDFVTIGTTGNATDFGNLTAGRGIAAGLSSAIRGLIAGGQNPGTTASIDLISITSGGNAVDFGDCTIARYGRGSTTDCIRGVFAGGAGPAITNVMDYVNISSRGDAVDFGDFHNVSGRLEGGCSTSHGGLG